MKNVLNSQQLFILPYDSLVYHSPQADQSGKTWSEMFVVLRHKRQFDNTNFRLQ